MIEFVSAILITTGRMQQMVEFYRDVLQFPLEEERHGATAAHYGCELGDIHFAIHPQENFESVPGEISTAAIRLAFTVFEIEKFVSEAAARGVNFLYPIKDAGFAKMTAAIDPDGNLIEFTQLSDNWFRHLEKRRQAGNDVVAKWHESTAT